MIPNPLTDFAEYTDVTNAQRLVRDNRGRIRYCRPWKKWLTWDGQRWCRDETGEIERLAKQTVRSMYHEASLITILDDRTKLANHALSSEYVSRIRAMITLAETEEGIAVQPSDLDRYPFALNCRNGIVDLKTGTLRPHKSDELHTKLAPVDFDPHARCPRFEKFLAQITGNNADLQRYIQRAFGYALTGSAKEQALFILHGPGGNGKTTLLEALRLILGDYAGVIPIDTLMMRPREGVSNDVALLRGLRFVSASEVEQGRRLAEAKVKDLTGGGIVQARLLYTEYFTFEPTHKIFMDCNHEPEIRGTDEGIWRRIKLIPLTVRISEADRDRDLPEKLREEAQGILAWAVRGRLHWQQHGLGEPMAIRTATSRYRDSMDLVAEFVSEECVKEQGAFATSKVLYEAFDAGAKLAAIRTHRLRKPSASGSISSGSRQTDAAGNGAESACGFGSRGTIVDASDALLRFSQNLPSPSPGKSY